MTAHLCPTRAQSKQPQHQRQVLLLLFHLNQIEHYKTDLDIRIGNARIYYENLKNINKLIVPKFEDNYENSWINFPIQYYEREKLIKYLYENNRDVAIYFYRNCNELKIFEK